MSLPALHAVSQGFPAARISILARPSVAALYDREPICDELIIYDAPRGWKGLGEKWAAASDLRRRRFDCAILLQNAFESALIAWMARIPVRIGYTRDAQESASDSSCSGSFAWRDSAASALLLPRAAQARKIDRELFL